MTAAPSAIVKLSLAELAALAQGTLAQGDPSFVLTGFSTIEEAVPGDVTFLGNQRYLPKLRKCHASAVLVPVGFSDVPAGMARVEVENPTLAFQSIITRFGKVKVTFPPGVHPSASIADGVRLDRGKVFVGACAVIEDGAVIGDGCEIHAGAYIGHCATLGAGCVIHPNAVIKESCILGNRVIMHSGAVVGSDGFGYELSDGRHAKLHQVGIVQIDDDVEIGSCSTIDRARFGRTWIGEGTKIDNLVQIAHNCVIGKHCILCAFVGISGSTRLGNYVTMAGQVGVGGHLKIGDQITILAKAGVTKDIPEPGAYTGFPTKPLMEGRRLLAAPGMVPDLIKRVRALEQRIKDLEAKLASRE